MPKYVNLLTDFAFKKIFADPNNKTILIDFLNTFIQEDLQITDVQVMKNEHRGTNKLDRSAIFDLYCTNQSGEHFIIEIQRAAQPYFIDRAIYYSSFLIQEQAIKGNAWNFNLKPIFTLSFLNFRLPKPYSSSDNFYHKF